MDDFQESLIQISNSSLVALDELWAVSDASGDQVSLLDTMKDPSAVDPARELGVSELKDRLAHAISRLPEREKLVVALYYYENLTLREIGEVLGVTESRVSQLHTKAVLRLKARLQSEVEATSTELGTRIPLPGQLEGRRRLVAHKGAQRIRNVAIVGHRGSGKTSLNEALLFEAGAINRLGSVADGSTVSDSEPDEVEREMSISASLASFEYDDRKINLIDTPGEPSFVADTLAALRVCESAVFVVNGVMGVEVTTDRLWQRADELGLARLVFVNMLDRERADFFRDARLPQGRVRPARGRDRDPDRLRARDARDRRPDRHEGLRVRRRRPRQREGGRRSPTRSREQADSYREKLMDEVAENSDELMERYLEGEEISHDEIVERAQGRRHAGNDLPGHLRDRDQEPRHRPAAGRARQRPSVAGAQGRGDRARRARATRSRSSPRRAATRSPTCSRRSPTRSPGGSTCSASTRASLKGDSQRHERARAREGAHRPAADRRRARRWGRPTEFGPGDIGAVAKLKETHSGDVLVGQGQRASRSRRSSCRRR